MASIREVAPKDPSEPEAADGSRYSDVAIVLHWLIAAAIGLQLVLGNRIGGPDTPEVFALTQLHKSVGITILLLSLARLAWRLVNPPPPMPATMARWEAWLARGAHVGFYVIMIGMPLTGWLMVSASRIEIPTLLYGTVPWPDMPGIAHLAPAAKKAAHRFAIESHELLAYFAYGLIGLHVAGALKHQLFSRDEPVLARMAPGAQAGRWLDPRLIAIAAAFAGVIGFGFWVQPPPPAMAAPTPSAAPETVAAPEPAAPPPTAAAPVAAAQPSGPVRWTVQPGSTLGFESAWSGQPLTGRFDKWRADILFSPDALAKSKVTVVIDVASVKTGDAQRDAALPGDDWFAAGAHPQAVFSANRFENTGADRYVAHGTLTLRGVSKPQDLAFRLTIQGDQATVSGTASLDRTAFGVGQGDFAGADQIPGKVAVKVALKARRAG